MKYCELFLRFPEFKTRAITFSIDDGIIDDRKMVEILNRHEIKCTFNLNSGTIKGNDSRVQFEEFEELYKGHEVAAHTYTHPHLENLELDGIAYQIIKDREILEEKTGKIVEGFAYPYGLCETHGMIDCIKNCGIRYGRTTASTYNFDLPKDFLRWNPTCHQCDPKLPELAETFFRPDDLEHPWQIKSLLFYIWGHSYEFHNKWENLEKICQIVGGKEYVWYATNGEIVDYISAFKALRRSVNGRIIHNPTDIDVYVRAGDKDILLKKGEITRI